MDAAEIVDVVSQFVTLKRRGVNYVGLCPFHSDTTPSFYVSPSKNICKCFACNEGGSSVHFIMKHEQMTYVEALKFLAKKYGIEVKERELSDKEVEAQNERESLFIITEYAKDFFENCLHNHTEGKSIGLTYFKERGFRPETIKKFQLGYSPEQKDTLSQDAIKQGYKEDLLEKSGLIIKYDNRLVDRFRGRVIFPIHTVAGRVAGFGGRILKKAENTGKYVNSPESSIYSKSKELYGIYFAKQSITKENCCYLVEGYTDVISMHQAGIENVVSSSGTALTTGQIKLIHRFTTNVTLIYDGDKAGINAALRGINLLLEEGLNIKVVQLPQGEDPDSYARKQSSKSFLDYIKEHETDFIRFKVNLLMEQVGNDPIKKANLIKDIIETISIIPEGVYRSVYIKECSTLLDVDEKMLTREVAKNRLAYIDNKAKEINKKPSIVVDDSTPVSVVNVEKKIAGSSSEFNKYEKDIIYFIVKFGVDSLVNKIGKETLDENEEQNNIEDPATKVIEYVMWDLQRDEIEFTNPVYKMILEETFQLKDDESFSPDKYFLSHPNSEISLVVANILAGKYVYSKIHLKQFGNNAKFEETPLNEKNNLYKSVPWVITELKRVHVDKKITEILTEIKVEKDFEKQRNLLIELQKLKEIKGILAKFLGERVVLK